MNERIQELSYQCWYNDPDTGKEEFDRTKFAELIIRGCVEIAKWTPSQFPNDEYVKNIKEHFGVECNCVQVYTAPPKAAEWVGLTGDEVPDLYKHDVMFMKGWLWAEEKLKEKNT